MADHKHIFPIEKMSKVFHVSRSGYYRWLVAPPSKRATENQQLRRQIHRIWTASRKKYGSPRIHRRLVAEGWAVSRPRVARLMQKMSVASHIRRKWVATTDSTHQWPVAPNLLERQFNPRQLGKVWVSDITYIPTRGGWQYLTTVMDLADRQILGWSLADGMKASQTTIPAWKMACSRRRPTGGLLFHSDQGKQYACREFTGQLRAEAAVTQSMSRKGNCWDNAPAESFFKTLKAELSVDTSELYPRQTRRAIFEFIEIWYNRRRLHSTLDYQTPAQVEQVLTQKQAA